jgi:hypothetical protein
MRSKSSKGYRTNPHLSKLNKEKSRIMDYEDQDNNYGAILK